MPKVARRVSRLAPFKPGVAMDTVGWIRNRFMIFPSLLDSQAATLFGGCSCHFLDHLLALHGSHSGHAQRRRHLLEAILEEAPAGAENQHVHSIRVTTAGMLVLTSSVPALSDGVLRIVGPGGSSRAVRVGLLSRREMPLRAQLGAYNRTLHIPPSELVDATRGNRSL